MIAVRGIYQGGDTVKLNIAAVPVNEPYEVEVAFLKPVRQPPEQDEKTEEKLARRQKAFERFMQYRGTLPANFDYQKELADSREERYGNID